MEKKSSSEYFENTNKIKIVLKTKIQNAWDEMKWNLSIDSEFIIT